MLESKTSKRLLQVAEDIREFVANMFAHGEIRDPRVQGLTIHHVKITPDLSVAKIYYITPDTANKKSVETALAHIAGYVRKSLGKQLLIRHVPEIHFYYDDNMDHSMKINELISKIHQDD